MKTTARLLSALVAFAALIATVPVAAADQPAPITTVNRILHQIAEVFLAPGPDLSP